ncbi:hypothetical protein CRG98_048106 [Punica granatum]|uniref:Uncharacterized protein n=1 Tax=Punica granatum TaxID=22663 RepID=A0A2I0HJJ1_PUNGR|nr:hypothetical protein CRG98_048106 [Punica granatum]
MEGIGTELMLWVGKEIEVLFKNSDSSQLLMYHQNMFFLRYQFATSSAASLDREEEMLLNSEWSSGLERYRCCLFLESRERRAGRRPKPEDEPDSLVFMDSDVNAAV